MHKKLIYYSDNLEVDRVVAVPISSTVDRSRMNRGMADPQGTSFTHKRHKGIRDDTGEIIDRYFGHGPDHV